MITTNSDTQFDRPEAEQSGEQPEDRRVYPAERAFSTPTDGNDPADLSVGWLEMVHKMHGDLPYVDDDEVSSS